VILLSGTPTSGKYENLWTQIHLLGWNISLDLYHRQYVNWKKIDAGGVEIKVVDMSDPYKNVDRLKKKLHEHGAVFMKTEEFGFDLPEQTFTDIKVNSSKEYKKFRKDKVVTTSDGIELVGDTSLTDLLYQRQLCGQYSSEKLQAVKDLIESTNDRLVVFYNFNDELYALKKIAADLERPTSEVNGHDKALEAYEEQSNSITLIQYQAGAMGLNLQKANKIIYFTLPLSSELFEQSKKRIHRIGQKEHCFYYQLIVRGSVEEQIQQTLEMRKDFTDELFKKNT
jgi:SNF2 family DNA or RNA helicase